MARVVGGAGVGVGVGDFWAVVGAAQARGATTKRSVRYRMTTSRGGRYGPKRAPRRGQRQVMQPNAARTLGVFLPVPGYSRAGAVSLNHTQGGHSMRGVTARMLLWPLFAAPQP